MSRAPTDLRLPPGNWGKFWSAYAHVVRNTVDHGVETAAQRRAAGKPERARVGVGITLDRGQVLVDIRDDGPGIDWEVIARRARERGLPHGTQRDLETALFADGVSSRNQASATSGRGVGLGAVRDEVRACGGWLEIGNNADGGSWLRCWLPAAMLSQRNETPAPLPLAVPVEEPRVGAPGIGPDIGPDLGDGDIR